MTAPGPVVGCEPCFFGVHHYTRPGAVGPYVCICCGHERPFPLHPGPAG
jgi:hypothetical protein